MNKDCKGHYFNRTVVSAVVSSIGSDAFWRYVAELDLHEIIQHSECNPQLPLRWHVSMAERVFRQWGGMAKMNVLFAGRWRDDFYVVEDAHQRCSGGSLHRLGNRTSILRILPFLQTGQVVTSIPQILSNCSCQDSGVSLSFVTVLHVPNSSRHTDMLSLRLLFASSPKCLMRTNRLGKT